MSLRETLHGKNINFLIGSGASFPVFKTLWLGDDKPSFEDIVSCNLISDNNKKALYYYYYKNWIKEMIDIDLNTINENVKNNYSKFISQILETLSTEGNEKAKRANIFTTNYDLLFEYTFESIIQKNNYCFFNDGSSGFITKTLNTNWYNLCVLQTGYNDKYKREIPTINLYKMHGSINWSKDNTNKINITYNSNITINPIQKLDEIDFINDIISHLNTNHNYIALNTYLSSIAESIEANLDNFHNNYKKLAIINPDKWKFYETVYEQHYYQMIRNFSYELEKKDTILIVFGFSFADEHILDIFKRTLSNPTLEVIIICYTENSKNEISEKIGTSKNIKYFPQDFTEIKGDFDYLNQSLNGTDNE